MTLDSPQASTARSQTGDSTVSTNLTTENLSTQKFQKKKLVYSEIIYYKRILEPLLKYMPNLPYELYTWPKRRRIEATKGIHLLRYTVTTHCGINCITMV